MPEPFLRSRYPHRPVESIDLLVDGGRFFPAMLDAVARAERSVALAIYQCEPGGCLDGWLTALRDAARRGVEVRLMADGFGSFSARGKLEHLDETGVRFAWFNPLRLRYPLADLFRDHRKLLLIDGRVGFIGGFCLTDGFDPRFSERPWHDMALRVSGPVVGDMTAEFDVEWSLRAADPARAEPTVAAASTPVTASCRLVRNHPLGAREIRRSFYADLRRARRRVRWVTPYFAPPGRLRRLLARAARRGVDVRLLVSGPETDHPSVRAAGQRFYGRLLRAGVRIYEYPDRCLHLKATLVDGRVSGGSCNFDHWGLRWNRDANLETDDPATVSAFARLIEDDLAGSNEITLEDHRRRPLSSRLRQRIAGWIDSTLLRSAYRRRIRELRRRPPRRR